MSPSAAEPVPAEAGRRQQTFFGPDDYALYRDLLGKACRDAGVEAWAWCLMPNHVHLILVPGDPDGLRHALARVHRAYAGAIHARQRRTGHFWQGRFGAVAMDEAHLAAAVRYVLLNPVRARLVERAEDWPHRVKPEGRLWSSLHAHLAGTDDGVTATAPLAARFPDLPALLQSDAADEDAQDRLRRAECIGRPVGNAAFLERIEGMLGRPVTPRKRGPKPKHAPDRN